VAVDVAVVGIMGSSHGLSASQVGAYDDVDGGDDPNDYDLKRIKTSSSKRKHASRQTQRCRSVVDGG
ncbi:hypothetical protein Tco_0902535, partial [Tanacetum coccineum]